MTDGRETARDAALVRALGTWGLVAAVVNVTVGAGIFRLPAAVATSLGPAAPIAYVVCAVAMGLIVLCFADAGSRVSLTGGLYAYVEVAFGPFVGFLAGVLLWAGLTAALAAVTSFFADSIGALFPPLSSDVAKPATVILVLASLATLNVLGVRGANRFNAVMTVAKLLPVALFIAVGAFAMHVENLAPRHAPGVGELARASMLLLFAFFGVEAALVPSGEVRDPARTVPRAVLLAIVAIAILYVAVQLVAQGVLGDALAGQKTPLAEAAGVALGPWGRTLILAGSSLAMFGNVSAMTLAVPRMLFAFARDGFLPRALANVHPRFRTPHRAIAIQTLLVAILAVTGSFERLITVAVGGVLLVYAACCLAAVELRRRNVHADGTPFQLPAARVVPWLALAIIAALLASVDLREWLAVLIVVAVAIFGYAVTRGRRAATAVSGSIGD
jgi:amino acid transporter